MNFLKVTSTIFILLITPMCWVSCSADESVQDTISNIEDVELEKGYLKDFQLSELSYIDLQMRQPLIIDQTEKISGQIIITVPSTVTNLDFSLSKVDFDTSLFSISPSVGSLQTFKIGNTVTYTVTSLKNPKKSFRYLVSVVKKKYSPTDSN